MTLPMPVDISDVTLAFPANALELMPAMEDIPEDFRSETTTSAPWYRFQSVWFSLGMHEKFSFQPAEIDEQKVDARMAYRHLAAIQGSYAPKHEHKMAAVAWLASLWMESVIYGPPDAELEELSVIGEATLDEWLDYFKPAS